MNNDIFEGKIKLIRRNMPNFALWTTIFNYVVTALVGGFILNQIIENVYIAFAISSSIQLVRGVIIFFGQLNPETPDFGYAREIAAAIFGALTIFEIWGLSGAIQWGFEVKTTLSILILGGSVIEIMLLQEIKTHNRREVMGSPLLLKSIHDTAVMTKRHKMFMRDLKKIDVESDIQDINAILTPTDRTEFDALKAEISHLRQKQKSIDVAKASMSKGMQQELTQDFENNEIEERLKLPAAQRREFVRGFGLDTENLNGRNKAIPPSFEIDLTGKK